MERYRLRELAQETGVTRRAIRFYIKEGLLPPPEGLGPAAAYTEGHRDRLRLIGRLKGRYLPLREIRRHLATLTDAAVRDELRRGEGGGTPGRALETVVGSGNPDGRAAVAYLDGLLGSIAGAAAPPSPASPPARRPPGPRTDAPGAPLGGDADAERVGDPPRERWERVVLGEGVELHVREDRRREVAPLEALIRHARELLGEG